MMRQLPLSPLPSLYKDHYIAYVKGTNRTLYVSKDYDACRHVAEDWNVNTGYWCGEEAKVYEVEEIYTQYLIADFNLVS